tara:strand:+ start:676 stop:1011 length:336 start_codon:yes stop_codon:yes gene_type:complete
MSEKNNILNLCVCMALCDHELNKSETTEILKIAKEIKTDFNVHNSTDDIEKKFSGNIDLAQDFYQGIIPDKRKIETKELIKRVALADGELGDKETRFLVRMKQAWGYEFFD